MKRRLPLLIALAVVLVVIVIAVGRGKSSRSFDERVTLRRDDKIPYGCFAARHLLPTLFPKATVSDDRSMPGKWTNLTAANSGQAVILIGRDINADEEELTELLDFVRAGNYVFLSGGDFSYTFNRKLGLMNSTFDFASSDDSLEVELVEPRFPHRVYHYAGRNGGTVFGRNDPDSVQVLGTNEMGRPNFVALRYGNGLLFVHGAPLAFSNYFLLQPGNLDYFEQVLSVIPRDVTQVVWNEYYLSKREGPQEEPNWLAVLLRHEGFAWGLGVLLAALLLYAFSEMRRRQRWIPPYERPRNESLDFVTTLGRLYYDKRDHSDLAHKMTTYFLEHVRAQYKLSTEVLDEDFIRRLRVRSGYPEEDLRGIVDTIQTLRNEQSVDANRLQSLYRRLESFYQNT
ncbi:DUF4350 domain-containing protein [Flaviaesturariibacter amylovorans]|uniref:DUF4350 domain-containing protein n=1 Tax=Flaviaesturariibacter amylovorans TaxID=1084520 RepID=A0ABP8GYQ1_9BACT